MKKITTTVLVAVFISFAGNSFAQFAHTWDATYQHTTTSGYSNEGRKVAEDASGNIFVLSDVTSNIDPLGVLGNSTYHYVTIVKYSSTGTVLNTRNLNIVNHMVSGFDNVSAFALEIDGSGNVYAGYHDYSAASNFDVILAKFSNSLSRLWSNTYSTNGVDMGMDMKVNGSGTAYAIVKSVNSSTIYSVIKSNPVNGPASLVYSYGNTEALTSLALDGGTTAYVAGSVLKNGYKDILISALNLSNSTLVWKTSYAGPVATGDDYANMITVGVDGKIYTLCTAYKNSNNGTDYLVLRNSPSTGARFDFATYLHKSVNDQGVFINAAEAGYLYIGGISGNSNVEYRMPSTGNGSQASGTSYTPVPSTTYSSITGITLSAMKVSSGKNVYVTGSVTANGPAGAFSSSYFIKYSVVFGNTLVRSTSLVVDGDFNENYQGVGLSLDYSKTDVYWLRNNWGTNSTHASESVLLSDLDAPPPLRTSGLVENANHSLQLFPNPAADVVSVSSLACNATCNIFDLTGKLVATHLLTEVENKMDVSKLQQGVYVCRIVPDNGEIVVTRLIIK